MIKSAIDFLLTKQNVLLYDTANCIPFYECIVSLHTVKHILSGKQKEKSFRNTLLKAFIYNAL